MKDTVDRISKSVSLLQEHPAFQEWKKPLRPAKGDVILVNNSFVYRSVKTVKNDSYLALRYGNEIKLEPQPLVARGIRINSDFKLVPSKSRNFPSLMPLTEAVSAELSSLGILVFLLIGEIEDNVVLSEAFNHAAVETLVWDPALTLPFELVDRIIRVRDASDEDALWDHVLSHFGSTEQKPPEGMREALGICVDKLHARAVARLALPTSAGKPQSSMTHLVASVLRTHRDAYVRALGASDGDTAPIQEPNEVLRIAYNFASDATTFLRLIVSICDLKPIVLWGTLHRHHALSEAFRNLPWERARVKSSLEGYESIVRDARNAVFHDLFPFRKTLEVELPQNALQNATIRLFSEYARKRENQLSFRDKEVLQVLFEFTRARYRRAPSRFWRQNVAVMDAAIELFEETGEHLAGLQKASSIAP
jgi:hypothetical protein